MTRESETETLRRAFDYPYDVAPRGFVFRTTEDGSFETRELPPTFRPSADAVPVLAIGSNRAPQQLARKYADFPPGTEIPLAVGRLADHDIVFLASFARYGALPAALMTAPGVAVSVHMMWLTPQQLERMHATEGPHNYRYEEREDLSVELEGLPTPEGAVGLYAPRIRPLSENGRPLPLAAIQAMGRSAPAMLERDALDVARRRLAPDLSLEAFVLRAVQDDRQRQEWSAALQAWEADHGVASTRHRAQAAPRP